MSGRHETTTHSNTVLLTRLGIDLTNSVEGKKPDTKRTPSDSVYMNFKEARATHISRLQKQLPLGGGAAWEGHEEGHEEGSSCWKDPMS